MQIGKQSLPRAQHFAFFCLGLFHLNNQLGTVEDLFGICNYLSPRVSILLIVESNTLTAASLNQQLVSTFAQFSRARRSEADTIFQILDFFGDPNQHDYPPTGTELRSRLPKII